MPELFCYLTTREYEAENTYLLQGKCSFIASFSMHYSSKRNGSQDIQIYQVPKVITQQYLTQGETIGEVCTVLVKPWV